MAVGEDLRVLLECRTFVGFFDMCLQRHCALRARQPHQVIQQAEELDVVRLMEGRTFQHLAERAQQVLDVVYTVAHYRRRDGGAADRPELEWHCLDQWLHTAAGGYVGPDYAGKQ